MIPPEIRSIIDNIIRIKRHEHEKSKGEAIRKHKFQMANQGITHSSYFGQALTKVYNDQLETFATNSWSSIADALEKMGFQPDQHSDQELLEFIKAPLQAISKNDVANFNKAVEKTPYSPSANLTHNCEIQLQRISTEIKIFTRKLQNMKEQTKPQTTNQTINYHLHGANSRVNINSQDQSVNIVSEEEMFTKLREALEAQVPDQDLKGKLLAKLEEGKAVEKNTKIYNGWFAEFMSLAANCIDVVQPFVPALAELLAKTN